MFLEAFRFFFLFIAFLYCPYYQEHKYDIASGWICQCLHGCNWGDIDIQDTHSRMSREVLLANLEENILVRKHYYIELNMNYKRHTRGPKNSI